VKWGVGVRKVLRLTDIFRSVPRKPRSLDVLDEIQSRPELAQTLLAYGRFRRGDNRQKDRILILRALRLFEEMGATGWVEEARAALAAV